MENQREKEEIISYSVLVHFLSWINVETDNILSSDRIPCSESCCSRICIGRSLRRSHQPFRVLGICSPE